MFSGRYEDTLCGEDRDIGEGTNVDVGERHGELPLLIEGLKTTTGFVKGGGGEWLGDELGEAINLMHGDITDEGGSRGGDASSRIA